ncbi:LPP20 family lipoprotein [Marinospirillum sp. MEB164]|uniref:LPP20 family lipoprotein n=1 Tax=Marinospirillum alkalitolerans TaxID=3123374 RepID=A0ABW8PXD7_9GAMM
MFKKTLCTGLIIAGLTLTAGCANQRQQQPATTSGHTYILGQFDPVVIRVQGHGAPSAATDVQTNANQRRLLAMRASKMDAYRALAERVYGTRIQGSTTVQNLATRDDHIRGYVDNIIRGAKVVATREVNGVFETEMELVLEPRFQHCMLQGSSMAADPICSQNTVHGEHPSQRLPVSQAQPRQRYHLN